DRPLPSLADSNTLTTMLIGNAVWLLECHPEQKALFLSDIGGRVDSLVDETLRFDSPIHGVYRRTTKDVIVADDFIEAGEHVFVCCASANRDPAVYQAPDEFRIDRTWKWLPPHLAFGHGTHDCVGAELARVEARVALGT
nr:cytochrome P450 [Micromonospora sp. DSM 115978]